MHIEERLNEGPRILFTIDPIRLTNTIRRREAIKKFYQGIAVVVVVVVIPFILDVRFVDMLLLLLSSH